MPRARPALPVLLATLSIGVAVAIGCTVESPDHEVLGDPSLSPNNHIENGEPSWTSRVPERSVVPSNRQPVDGSGDQSAVAELVGRFRLDVGGSTERWDAVASALFGVVSESISSGQIEALDAYALHDAYLYPNDAEQADRRFRGRYVVLAGLVTPDNMDDLRDLYKVYEEEPYAHFPLLLETNYEFNFVKCHLVEPRVQTLFDWQEVELLGRVRGKDGLHIVLDDCVVLSAKREPHGDPRPSFFVRERKSSNR